MQGTKKVVNFRWERFKRDFKMVWNSFMNFKIEIFKNGKVNKEKVNNEKIIENKELNRKRKIKSKY